MNSFAVHTCPQGAYAPFFRARDARAFLVLHVELPRFSKIK